MIPKIVYEGGNLATIFSANYAWYTPEDATIHIVKGVKPRWLAFLHEFGHHLISYFPNIIHYHVSVDYEYDRLWSRLGLSGFIDVSQVRSSGGKAN